MRRFAAALVLVSTFVGCLSIGAAPAPAATKLCKNTYGGDVIQAKNLKCKRARAVVRAWAAGFKQDGQVDRIALGFNCADRSNPVEGLVVRCTRSGRRVIFYANVP